MKTYFEYLLKQGVATKKLAFYRAWLDQYKRFCDDRGFKECSERSLVSYESSLLGKYESWQVNQARSAVLLFQKWHDREDVMRHDNLWKRCLRLLATSQKGVSTQACYRGVIKKFLMYCDEFKELNFEAIYKYMVYLNTNEGLSKSSQNQVLSGLNYFYREVMNLDLSDKIYALRVKKKKVLPRVFGRNDLKNLFSKMDGQELLMAKIMYGSGLRSGECHRLRVRDLDFERGLIQVVGGLGELKRSSILPDSLKPLLKRQLLEVGDSYKRDEVCGLPGVLVGDEEGGEIIRCEWEWYWLFPSEKVVKSRVTGKLSKVLRNAYYLRNSFKKACGCFEDLGDYRLDDLRHSFAISMSI